MELVDGLDRMPRILMAYRPNALRSVPDCAALCRKLATGNFSFCTDPLGFKSRLKRKKEHLSMFLLELVDGLEPPTC